MRMTVACPTAIADDANSLAMCLAEGPADGKTFSGQIWVDGSAVEYFVASFDASDLWIAAVQSPLVRPAWDIPPYTVNLTGAERAQAALDISLDPTAPPVPTSATIAALGSLSGVGAVGALGLVRKPVAP